MKIAIMQPYVFPYIGYFQLINAVDIFVFYDDVNYIKGGWVNRNRILINNKEAFLTIPCLNKSPNKLIKDISVNISCKEYKNLLLTIELAYKKAKYFKAIFPLIEEILLASDMSISELGIKSIISFCRYLDINTDFKISSIDYSDSKGEEKSQRLISISKKIGAENYINPSGGLELYQQDYFSKGGIKLDFIKSNPIVYSQFNNEFIPWLSMIDVLMFNSKDEIHSMLNNYDLI